MDEPQDFFALLLNKCRQTELENIRGKLLAISSYAGQYVPQMAVTAEQDEFLYHAGGIRQQACTLFEECGKVSEVDGEFLNRIKGQFNDLKDFFEYWLTLRSSPDEVERVHAAL